MPSLNVDLDYTMVTGPPGLRIRRIDGLTTDIARQCVGCEHEVQLAGSGFRGLLDRTVRHDVLTFTRQFIRPRISLTTVGKLRTDEAKTECRESVKHGVAYLDAQNSLPLSP